MNKKKFLGLNINFKHFVLKNSAITLIYALVVSIFLVFAVSSLSCTISTALTPTSVKENSISSSFDEDTIKKLSSLHSSSDNLSISLPSGRINPFAQ